MKDGKKEAFPVLIKKADQQLTPSACGFFSAPP